MRCLVAAVVGGLCGACLDPSPPSPPIQPGTNDIPLRVWQVLKDDEYPGGVQNKGSRLTSLDVTAYITHLRQNSHVFGTNINFQWPTGSPIVIRDPGLLLLPPIGSREVEAVQFLTMVVGDTAAGQPVKWTPEHINIYFCGNIVDSTGPAGPDMGGTVDPAKAATAPNPNWRRAFIVINDGGFNRNSGIDPDFSPAQVRGRNSLEHEMEHFLARFKNRTIGSPPNHRVYDSFEHETRVLNNLLRTGGANPVTGGYPLFIPGMPQDLASETGEIYERINGGNWSNP